MVKNCPTIHLCGILSDGGVHGHQDHLFKMIELFNRHKSNIFVHCFLDGRDTNPTSGYKNMKLLLDMIKKINKMSRLAVYVEDFIQWIGTIDGIEFRRHTEQ